MTLNNAGQLALGLLPSAGVLVKKKVDRKLLVYIQKVEGGPVSVEVVETTKNGHSYRLDGEIWNRGSNFFCRENCTNQAGLLWKIAPLRRDYVPNWVNNENLDVNPSAKDRYELWVKKQLRKTL